MNKLKQIGFINKDLREAYSELKEGKFESKELYKFINRAMDDLKQNPNCGMKMPKKLWPKEYIQNYGINNLWKYNLPNAWRLIYTVVENEIKIMGVILEWMKHKDYERRFKY